MTTTTTTTEPTFNVTGGTLIHTSECSALTKTDRCDRCGAQAWGRALLNNGKELLFCGHHLRVNMEAIAPVSRRVEDYTEALHKEEAGGLTAV